MKVGIKQFNVEMQLKTKGMELEVRDNKDNFLGDLCIGKAKVEWCAGKTQRGHGVSKTWEELIQFFNEQE